MMFDCALCTLDYVHCPFALSTVPCGVLKVNAVETDDDFSKINESLGMTSELKPILKLLMTFLKLLMTVLKLLMTSLNLPISVFKLLKSVLKLVMTVLKLLMYGILGEIQG